MDAVFDTVGGDTLRRSWGEPMSFDRLAQRPWPDCPLIVAYGVGVDSTAMLIEFAFRGIRPDHILFADTGGESIARVSPLWRD